MTLPLLDAMRPLRADADVLRRMVSIETNMGILPQFFFPEKAHRDQLTVFSGTPPPERGGFQNWVSLDQYAADQFGNRSCG
jgi:hypothetical protein